MWHVIVWLGGCAPWAGEDRQQLVVTDVLDASVTFSDLQNYLSHALSCESDGSDGCDGMLWGSFASAVAVSLSFFLTTFTEKSYTSVTFSTLPGQGR